MQVKIIEFNNENDLVLDPVTRVLDLVSEVGEVSKEVIKATSYGKHEFTDKNSDDLAGEIGDVYYALISLASECGLDLNKCLDITMQKYETRLAKKKNISSGK